MYLLFKFLAHTHKPANNTFKALTRLHQERKGRSNYQQVKYGWFLNKFGDFDFLGIEKEKVTIPQY